MNRMGVRLLIVVAVYCFGCAANQKEVAAGGSETHRPQTPTLEGFAAHGLGLTPEQKAELAGEIAKAPRSFWRDTAQLHGYLTTPPVVGFAVDTNMVPVPAQRVEAEKAVLAVMADAGVSKTCTVMGASAQMTPVQRSTLAVGMCVLAPYGVRDLSQISGETSQAEYRARPVRGKARIEFPITKEDVEACMP